MRACVTVCKRARAQAHARGLSLAILPRAMPWLLALSLLCVYSLVLACAHGLSRARFLFLSVSGTLNVLSQVYRQ